jgi:predicted ATPase
MKMTRLRIENYKGLREIDIPLSRFVCLIGDNKTLKGLAATYTWQDGAPPKR